MTQSLAAVFAGNVRELDLQKIELPSLQAGEVLVRVLGCTLCGSDLHTYEGHRQVAVPTVLGHEIVGEIVELAADAPRFDLAGQELRIGDRVTWAIVASCGACFYCDRGLPQKCLHSVKYGHEKLRPGQELLGGLAEYCLLVRGTAIIRLPEELPLAVACPASCATATVAAALAAAGDVQGQIVCVLGAGMLGLTACAMSSARGAAEVICIDVSGERRARALQFGATQAIAPEQLQSLAHELSAGQGIDLVLEFTGATAALENAWPRLRIGGRVVLIGSVFPGPAFTIQPEQVVRRMLTITGVHNYGPGHLVTAIDFLTHFWRKFPFADLVAAWHPLADAEQAFAVARESGAVRIGVLATGK